MNSEHYRKIFKFLLEEYNAGSGMSAGACAQVIHKKLGEVFKEADPDFCELDWYRPPFHFNGPIGAYHFWKEEPDWSEPNI